MKVTIDDLGVALRGDAHLDWAAGIMAVHPATGEEFVIHPAFHDGFLVIDPRRKTAVHVRCEAPDQSITGRIVIQRPDGSILLAGGRGARVLLAWNWQGDTMRPAMECNVDLRLAPLLECDSDGNIYCWNSGHGLFRIDARGGAPRRIAPKVGTVACGRDNSVYLQWGGTVSLYDPRTEAMAAIRDLPAGAPALKKDGAGRVILPMVVRRHEGRAYWLELRGDRAVPVDAAEVRLTETILGNNEAAVDEPFLRMQFPYVFKDGSYISRFIEDEVTLIDPEGRPHTFRVTRHDRALTLFAVQSGGHRIWMSSILPLVVGSYTPKTGRFRSYRTPTMVVGEVYSMACSGDRLFTASYPRAFLTRLDPERPLRYDRSVQANPAQLGPMKIGNEPPNRSLEPGRPVGAQPAEAEMYIHRPRGWAVDPAGNVYFAAVGDYGCPHSGICRIDRHTEAVERWVYPRTSFNVMAYLPEARLLAVAERREGEGDVIRLTFIDPATGEVRSSHEVLRDQGHITALFHDGGDRVYGLHDYRASLFAWSLSERRVVATMPELGFGHQCLNNLIAGPDGRIWGLSLECLYAVDRDLTRKERLCDYPDYSGGGFYRFGLAQGPEGHLYFANGTHLMRARIEA